MRCVGSEELHYTPDLPAAAAPAVTIIRRLREAGHAALLNGGCVRDLLLGGEPNDYDVATDATPERVCEVFRVTRRVGAQFGVVLVRVNHCWIEVATFRSDGDYSDGRRPDRVTYTDARHDARRRDFTINAMFLDPLDRRIIDYVDGRADLDARLIRAVGEPARRFAEDHLRLLRAIRFAARLGFDIEPNTLAAICEHAAKLVNVASERVREELEKMLTHRTRRGAFQLLRETDLLRFLWPDAEWSERQIAAADVLLSRLPQAASFLAAFAALLLDRGGHEVERICGALTCSNDRRRSVVWLVEHACDLDEPASIDLAGLKRLLAHAAFGDLRTLIEARFRGMSDGARRMHSLEERIAAIAPQRIAPPPWVTGQDLIARGVPAGPRYKEILHALYTRQLDEALNSRDAALAALDELLASM